MELKLTFLKIVTDEGFLLPAYLLDPPSPRGGVLVFHGFKSSKDFMLGLGAIIARQGYSVLLPDQRGAGENKNPIDLNMFQDIVTSLDFLKRKFSSVAMVGYSLSGYAALSMDVSAIVSISPPSKDIIINQAVEKEIFPPHIIESIFKGFTFNENSPKLILYGEKDNEGFPEAAEDLGRIIPFSQVIKIPGAYHGSICYTKEVLEIVPLWLDKHMKI